MISPMIIMADDWLHVPQIKVSKYNLNSMFSSNKCVNLEYFQVWDIDDDGQWTCTSSWKTHAGSVWKVTWAHPEFGQILATCSFDRTAIVWEEMGIIKFLIN